MKLLSFILLLLISTLILKSSISQDWQCGDTLFDARDGQSYPTVQISNNCWMAKNLNIGSMVNKDSLVSDNGLIEKYCFNNEADSCGHHGGLYDWEEAMDYTYENGTQGICPEAWHIMTDEDFMAMEDSLGGGLIAGGKLKATGYRYWASPNTGATNESGFTGLGSGRITYANQFVGIRSLATYWTSTRYITGSDIKIRYHGINYNTAFTTVFISPYETALLERCSVRCVKDKSLSVESFHKEDEIKIQPNPFEANTEIILEKDITIRSLKLMDVNGQVYYPEINHAHNKIILSRGNLSSGIYTLFIQTKRNKLLRTKIVVK